MAVELFHIKYRRYCAPCPNPAVWSLWCCPPSWIKCSAQQMTDIHSITKVCIYIASWKNKVMIMSPNQVLSYFGFGYGTPWYRQSIFQCDPTYCIPNPVGHFVLIIYAQVHCKSFAEARIKAWSTKVGRTLVSAQSTSHCLQPTSLSMKT